MLPFRHWRSEYELVTWLLSCLITKENVSSVPLQRDMAACKQIAAAVNRKWNSCNATKHFKSLLFCTQYHNVGILINSRHIYPISTVIVSNCRGRGKSWSATVETSCAHVRSFISPSPLLAFFFPPSGKWGKVTINGRWKRAERETPPRKNTNLRGEQSKHFYLAAAQGGSRWFWMSHVHNGDRGWAKLEIRFHDYHTSTGRVISGLNSNSKFSLSPWVVQLWNHFTNFEQLLSLCRQGTFPLRNFFIFGKFHVRAN